MRTLNLLAATLLLSLSIPYGVTGADNDSAKGEYFLYVGTYTRSTSKGIYGFRFSPSTGKMTPLGLVAPIPSPSFLAVHPNQRFLYATNEREYEEKMGNKVSAFAIDPKSGQLTLLNRVASQGDGPVHDTVDKTGKALVVANYRGGSVAVLPIKADGSLGEATASDAHRPQAGGPQAGGNPDRQRPIVHGVAISPDGRFVAAAENGMDEVRMYRFDAAKGTLVPTDPPFLKVANDLAPRHPAFHPNGKALYILNEHASSVTVLAYSAVDGAVHEIQTISTLPADFSGRSSAGQLQVDKTGKFLYTSNRGHDSIAVFAIDAAKGTLSPIETIPTSGMAPRDFSLDPTGAWLFVGNQSSNSLTLFHVDAKSGRLASAGAPIEVPEPACIAFARIN
jgi:6-phosphogluconolactonase